MLSERKLLLRVTELVAIAATLTALYLAVRTYRTPDANFPIFLWGAAGMGATMFTFLPACMLGGEYAKTARKPTNWRQRSEGLSAKDVSAMVHWAPTSYKVAAAAAVLIVVGTALKFGSIEFRSSEKVDMEKIPGMFLYLSAFFLLALPILGSAARMPGTYTANSDA